MMEHVTAITHMVSYEPSMLYTTVTDDDAEIKHSGEDYVAASQSESDDNNDAEEEELQPPVIPVIENTATQQESSQCYNSGSCRENGTRADTYVPEIYSRQMYRRTYRTNFNPVLSENFWRDVPYNLIFYPPNMNKERDRKQGTRFQGEMDYRNPNSPPRCGRYHMPGHNRKNCNNPGSNNV
ncbi:hypothetical protein M9H77_27456 [Catharanthus roseus]|uniref:Uncharacterized protein n=1 Tax=Catharanthus roseus TaxID=4058 RepID=A0ACC0ACJ4_CATRO|nr:hypothetical protein M9H77_27456 [Catharanthus roseus]